MGIKDQPIAIVGIGCRFPGKASSPEKFWELMVDKQDAIVDIPFDRWDARKFYDEGTKPGKIKVKQAGFLQNDIKEFDPFFFGISPAEAEALDPQSRILLEVAYEALEDAGMKLENIKGSKTGVFIGGLTVDNLINWCSTENMKLINSHTSLGTMLTMLSNRLSYFFDLTGPSLTIDTACSSSLVATHYACQSILNGESEMALVGGVNVMTNPSIFVLLSKGQFLSKHSRCKSFDSDAGGYTRGEGGGIVLLKPYEKAIEDGDRIYALIEGTGVNQDGQTNGITVPNIESQKTLIRKVYAESGVSSNDIDYVEAHGTGTPVGDPIEFNALNEVLSENRDEEDKLLVGSVKSNIGHLEAGAGIAGLIKAALTLHKNMVPANIHFNTPNPALNYKDSILRVPTSLEKLPESKDSFASVNSFGYGGTNAHAVLKQFNANGKNDHLTLRKRNNIFFPVTARSKASLKERVCDYRKFIENNPDDFNEIFSNVVHRRTFHTERLAVFANSTQDLIEKLEAFEEDISVKGVSAGSAPEKKPKVAFVYTGMGPQWWKMGRELMEKEPVFMEAIEECDKHFTSISGWSVLDELLKPEESSKMHETDVSQTANFVLQVGLTRLLKYYGIVPDAVVGHSAGEISAIHNSGALSLYDSLYVIHQRSHLLNEKTSGKGGMLAVGRGEKEVNDIIRGYKDVSIAAINSYRSVTLSGKRESLEELSEKFRLMKIFSSILDVDIPYHSSVMDLVKEDLLEALKNIHGKETSIDIYSTVTGDKVLGERIDDNFCWRNVRQPVQFAKAFNKLVDDGYTIFVEIGPHPVLKGAMVQCVDNTREFNFLQTLNKKISEELSFFENLSILFASGCDIMWDRWVDKSHQIALPPYPWQKKKYWLESEKFTEYKIGRVGNTFLNTKVDAPIATYKVDLNNEFFPFLKDHIVQDRVVFPGAGYVAAAIALQQNELQEKRGFGLENIQFHQMLSLNEDEAQYLYISLNPVSNHFAIHSKTEAEDASWVKHAAGKCISGSFSKEPSPVDIPSLISMMDLSMSKEDIYEKLSRSKLNYGPTFKGIEVIYNTEKELVAQIKGNADLEDSDDEYFIHPALLDSCFQTLIAFDKRDNVPVVPVSIGSIRCFSHPGLSFVCHVKLNTASFNYILADITIYDQNGKVAMIIEDIKCQEIISKEYVSDEFPENCFYQIHWVEESVELEMDDFINQEQDTTYIVVTEDYASSLSLTEQLNGEVLVLQRGSDLRELGENHYEINLNDEQSIATLIGKKEHSNIALIYTTWSQSKTVNTLTTEECLGYINPLRNLIKYCTDALSGNLMFNIITRGGQDIREEDSIHDLGTSVFLGLGRLMANEFPGWNIRLIDFDEIEDTSVSKDTWKIALAKSKTSKRPLEELAIREDQLYKKVLRAKAEKDEENSMKSVKLRDCVLELASSDSNTFNFKEIKRSAPLEDEIELLIENIAIDHKDYLKLTHKAPVETFEGTYSEGKIGTDCVGVVTRVGENVTRFREGDRVIALSNGVVKSYTTINEQLVEICPNHLGNDAANIISPYLTALFCLKVKANLQKGQKILIHDATDGVGLACINYAMWVGAEIYATANNEKKCEYLKSLGIQYAFNSNDLDFSSQILCITQGKGVDVVMGSATGGQMHQSLTILASYGIYLELGKSNAIKDEHMSMKVFNKNLSFISVDIDQLFKERPGAVSSLMHDLQECMNAGHLQPLTTRVFSPKQLKEAFDLIEKDEFVGRVIVDFKDQSIDIEHRDQLFKSEGTYLITGGTKGLGLEIANWAVNKGAKNLVLLSRSGDKDPKVKTRIASLKKEGANVLVYAVDVADMEGMTSVFSDIKVTLPPLAGVFHGAMVLDDGFLLDMDNEKFSKVLRPKVDGAMNLHKLTLDSQLDFFIMFSSISSLVGNVGQANYVVANTLLDSFAYSRQKQGLTATAINLGTLGESGVIARDESLKETLKHTGIRSFTNDEVLIALEEIVKEKPTQIGLFDMDWSVFEKNFNGSKISLFEELIQESAGSGIPLNEEQAKNWNALKALSESEQQKFVIELLTEELSQVLKMPKDQITVDKGINFLGVDSILSVQLIRAINGILAVELSPVEFIAGPNLKQLSKIIIDRIIDSSEDKEVSNKVAQIK